jgi:hypothetical protein
MREQEKARNEPQQNINKLEIQDIAIGGKGKI